jgi:hypothetical protein
MPFLPVIGQWFEFMHPPAAYFVFLEEGVKSFRGSRHFVLRESTLHVSQ